MSWVGDEVAKYWKVSWGHGLFVKIFADNVRGDKAAAGRVAQSVKDFVQMAMSRNVPSEFWEYCDRCCEKESIKFGGQADGIGDVTTSRQRGVVAPQHLHSP